MMSRLIDADMVRQGKFCLSPLHADKDDTYYYQLGWNSAIETICDCVPTVDPIKHGHWEVVDGTEPRRYGCSVCKRLSWTEDNYCSYCGCKMDEVTE